jgi:large subunit ribosomal protein L30
MFAVIRIRGTNRVNREVEATLRMMHLKAPNNCVLLPETPSVKGMLQKTKDLITWGEIDKETLSAMLKKRLRVEGGKKLDERNLKEIAKVDSFESLAEALIEGKVNMNKGSFKIPFRLTPPSKGFKSVKTGFPKGDIGYRGKEINRLIERMI